MKRTDSHNISRHTRDMTTKHHDHLPDPSREAVNTWLMRMSLGYLHDAGWEEVNRRSHALAMGGRKFANENFADSPEAREGFYAGLTLGLLGQVHFGDIRHLTALLNSNATSAEAPVDPLLEGTQLHTKTTDGDADGGFPSHAA